MRYAEARQVTILLEIRDLLKSIDEKLTPPPATEQPPRRALAEAHDLFREALDELDILGGMTGNTSSLDLERRIKAWLDEQPSRLEEATERIKKIE